MTTTRKQRIERKWNVGDEVWVVVEYSHLMKGKVIYKTGRPSDIIHYHVAIEQHGTERLKETFSHDMFLSPAEQKRDLAADALANAEQEVKSWRKSIADSRERMAKTRKGIPALRKAAAQAAKDFEFATVAGGAE